MFSTARRRLTTLYLIIIMTISISFSFVVYKMSTRELDRFSELQRARIERSLENGIYGPGAQVMLGSNTPLIDPQLVTEVKSRTIVFLIYVNGVILLFSSVSGYFLADRTLKPIKEMVEEQHRFISDASHELKTPLTSLKLAFEIYLRNKSNTKKNADSIIIESLDEVNRLQKLTESLLTIASLKKSSAIKRRQKIDLKHLVDRMSGRFLSQLKAKRLSLNTHGENIFLTANVSEMEELFSIILDNAIKYSPNDKQINITIRKDSRYIYLLVKDQGSGISKKDMPHIFERFYRADQSHDKTISGYGLGLPIAKQIVQNYNGEIIVKSLPNRGTEVTIKLPR